MSKALALWRDLYQQHRITWFVLFTALMLASGLIFGTVINKAAGAPAPAPTSQRMCTHNPDMTCAVTPKRAVRLFENGHYARSSGLPWKRTTTHVRAVKAVFRHKFAAYYMHASAAKQRAIRQRYGLHFSTARDSGGCSFGWGMAACAAGHMLASVNKINCPTTDDWLNYDSDQCTTVTGLLHLGHGQGLSKERVKQTGTVGYCAGNAYLGVKAAGESDTGPGLVFMALWGTSQCGFAAWVALDGP